MLPVSTGAAHSLEHQARSDASQLVVMCGGRRIPSSLWLCSRVVSISAPILKKLAGMDGAVVTVVGRFRRVIDLAVGEEIVALTTWAVGDGPFHIVLDALPDSSFLPERVILRWRGSDLHLGPLVLHIDDPPPLWNPRPDWAQLRPRPAALARLRTLACREAEHRPTPFAGYLSGRPDGRLEALKAFWSSDKMLGGAVASLAGWGKGLTPSGDDFIAGMLVALWTDYAALTPRAAFLYQMAAARTTRLSRAVLRAARDGFVDAHWHALLTALAGVGIPSLREAVEAVFAFGATSGLDMVAGFLFYWFDLGGLDSPSCDTVEPSLIQH